MHENLTDNTIQVVYKTYLQEQYHHILLELHGLPQQITMLMGHLGTTVFHAHQDTLQCSHQQQQ